SQAGEQALERIERIRQAAVGFRRAEAQKSELEGLLNALDLDQTMDVVRSFSFFSHLLNIAEDEQQHRRRRAHAQAGSPRRPGSFSHALDEVRHLGFQKLAEWFARARVSPVLTAHPTEVQRQSILDCEREIARLIAQPQSAERDEAIHAEVLRLWLTSMLRFAKLEVADEVANGINYFRLTFLHELPRLYAEFERLAERSGDLSAHRQDEPYRRAITGIYARLAASAESLAGHAASPQPVHKGTAYANVEEFAAELGVISRALKACGAELLARG